MLPASMEDAEDVDALALNKIEELVGKTPREDAPETPVVHALPCRILFELRHRVFDCQQELHAESGPLLIVPVAGFLNVGVRERMDVDAPDQDAFRSRISASTSRHGRPAPGLRA